MPYRMFIEKDTSDLSFAHSSSQTLRSLLCFAYLSLNGAKCFHSFLFLGVLDLHRSAMNGFPKDMELLVQLRYLTIWNYSKDFPSSICNLWGLQTIIYITCEKVVLPSNISDLVNLRHLRTSHPYVKHKNIPFVFPSIEKLMNLQTISAVELGDGVDSFQMCFPYIKELRCFTNSEKKNDFKSLTCLEKLKVTGFIDNHINHISFPHALKTLTLRECGLPWSDMSIIQSLANLQVLKLYKNAFKGRCWNTDGREFQQLKFLRLEMLDIKVWEAYSESFPCLRELVIYRCDELEKIPLEFGGITTLQLIDIADCIDTNSLGESGRRIRSLRESAERIQEEQTYFWKL
ncbi:putative leucine-rich repeat domain superfamily [Helianthus annuus]|nr:putative leucine-rich repeat domain superfamily [Helianthus annuus]KAJ0632635.1 putative leucine-rich repeat domain superfamily [Helianthus annuus]